MRKSNHSDRRRAYSTSSASLRAQEAFKAWPQTEERLQRLEAAVSQHDVVAVRRLVMLEEAGSKVSQAHDL